MESLRSRFEVFAIVRKISLPSSSRDSNGTTVSTIVLDATAPAAGVGGGAFILGAGEGETD